MDFVELKELIAYFCEQGLIGKRFILAFMIVMAWLYAFMSGMPIPPEVTATAGMVLAFYFGSHGPNAGGAKNE